MTPNRNRLTIQLTPELSNLLNSLSSKTGVSVSALIRGALLFRLEDFHSFNEWIDTLPSESKRRFEAIEVLKSPGPNSILQDIKRIDPTYKTAGDLIAEEVAQSENPRLEARMSDLEEQVRQIVEKLKKQFSSNN